MKFKRCTERSVAVNRRFPIRLGGRDEIVAAIWLLSGRREMREQAQEAISLGRASEQLTLLCHILACSSGGTPSYIWRWR